MPNMTEIREAITAAGGEYPKNARKPELETILVGLEAEAVEAEEGEKAKNMGSTLAAYKAAGAYIKSVTAAGKPSMRKADDIAAFLATMLPEEVAALATEILGLDFPLYVGDGTGKYDRLNPGQVRMNSGNRIRAALKRGDIVEADVFGEWGGSGAA
jgi:hypothetical protein